MNILTQNGKMKKSSQNGIDLFNFGIPAFLSTTGLKTCPNAGVCATGCYARSGTYRFGNTVKAYENRLTFTQSKDFVEVINAEIKLKALKSKSKGNKCIIRIHDSGDFYSRVYLTDWIMICLANPDTQFYAYTKMVDLCNEVASNRLIPSNLRLIYSFGGKQDHLINVIKDYHSRVFESIEELTKHGYVDATNDDLVAAIGTNPRIGLVYHGVKGFLKTSWNRVK